MVVKKRYLVICLMLLLMMIGGVAASEDASDDAVKTSGDNATLTVENEIVEEDNLALDGGSDPEEIESDDSNDENVLSASNENDVLGKTVYDTGVTATIPGLNSFLTGNSVSNGDDVILTKNYIGSGGTAAGASVKFKSLTGKLNNVGGAVTLDMGVNENRFFNIPSGSTVTFENIIFKNAHRMGADNAENWGGAIYVGSDSTVTFINCSFVSNYQEYRGGAIYFDSGCIVNITNCSFDSNYLTTPVTQDGGGAIYFSSGCSAEFIGSNFTGNHMMSNDHDTNPTHVGTSGGGAIHFDGDADGIRFTKCIFDSNYVEAEGNHDRIYGGAIHCRLSLTNSIFTNCTFKKNYLEGVNAYGHEQQPHGAVMKVRGSSYNVTFNHCVFLDNLAYSYNRDDNVAYYTSGAGGAVCFLGDSTLINFTDSYFNNNSLYIRGVKTYAWGGCIAFMDTANDIYITDTQFINNTIYASDLVDRTAANSAVSSYGGAIYIKTAENNINIYNSKFDGNSAKLGYNGECMTGAIYFGGTKLETITIKDTYFARNSADGKYAVINFLVPVENCNFINVTFDDNIGETASLFFGDEVINTNIIDSNFVNNVNDEVNGLGAGIYIETAKGVNIKGSTFYNNSAINSNYGSALYINGGNNAQVDNCTFNGNTIAGNGAAIYWNVNNNKFTTNNSYFINNTSPYGPTIYFNHAPSTIELYNSYFIGNDATGDYGGALDVPSSTTKLLIDNCTFANNIASKGGMAIYLPSSSSLTTTITDSHFINNDFLNGNGGAIYSASTGTINISGSEFKDNDAKNGATIYLASNPSSLTITGTNFTNNKVTSGNGGALTISGTYSKTIDDCSFSGNAAPAGKGNAIYVSSGSNQNTISNSDFSEVNPIYVDQNGAVSLENNDELAQLNGNNYAVMNYKGTISLSGNNFNNVIINEGTITSQTYANISGNKSYDYYGYKFPLNASITDDHDNKIISKEFRFIANHDVDLKAEVNLFHKAVLTTTYESYFVGGKDTGLTNLYTYNATIWVYPKTGSYTWLQVELSKLNPGSSYVLTMNVTFDPIYDMDENNRYHDIINFENGVWINKTINFNGNGNTISGLNQARIFNITSSGVSISNTKFVNATAGKGGAIYIKEGVGSFTLTKCSFEDNHADVGGAIYHNGNGNTINIIDSSFNANTANEGGAIQFNAASAQSYADITIRGSNFTNNKAFSSSLGGSAVSLNRATEVEISNSKFDSNFAAGIGAVIFDYCTNVEVTLCNFISNNATENAGAIYFKRDGSGFYTVSLSNFTNNKARNGGAVYIDECSGVEIKNSKFTLNKATNDASAIYSNKDMMVEDSVFEDNTASNAGTIKLYNEHDSKISGSVFTQNNAATAAAIWATGDGVEITRSNFTSNKATGEAGAVYFDSAGLIEYCNFTSNSATNGAAVVLTKDTPLQYSYFEDNHATGNGTIYIKSIGVRTTVLSSTFIDNDALNGGAIYYVTTEMAPDLYILYSDFINNTAEHNGGAIYYVFAGDVLYRDYHNFDDRGEIVLGKTSVKFVHGSDVFGDRIAGCGFTNNRDYNFNVTATPRNQTSYITISLTDKVDVFSAEVNITLISLNGTVITRLFNPSNFSRYYSPTFAYFQYAFPGLENDTNYTVKVSFSDKKYVFKNETITFITGHGNMGEFAYLQSLIDKAIKNPQETINGIPVLNLTGESFTFNKYDDRQMHINETIIINLNGGTISAEGMCRIFNITANNVILMNIRFVNGNVEGNGSFNDTNMKGGAIYWCGENGTVMGSDFDNNFAHYGGGIYFNSTAVDCKIVECTFDDNTAKYRGGAIDCNATRMNLNHTVFTDNHAQYGAALCREANADGGFGYNNTFIANNATVAGPALAWMNSSAIRITNYYFYDNVAGHYGGAIYVGNGSQDCQIINCDFARNYVVNATDGHGGAIDWYALRGNVINSTFTDNRASIGGAICVHTSSGNVSVIDSEFTRNNATAGNGGAIFLEASSVTVNNSYFKDNVAWEGGAIYVGGHGETNDIYSSTFEGNNATRGRGGAVDWVAAKGIIRDSLFTNNFAAYGGGIYMGGDASNSSIYNVTFKANKASKNGGAIDWNATGGELVNTRFIENEAYEYGAALCRETGATSGYGHNNTFTANYAHIAGAALAWMGSVGININTYYFYDNHADDYGGAIYVGPNSHNCVINNSVFRGNYVNDGEGGAIYSTATNASIINSTFNDNWAADGGAMYVGGEGRTNYIYSSSFTNNRADGGRGGAVNWAASAGHIIDTNFTDNYADYGGAVYLGGDSNNSAISHVIFDHNTALHNGGAIDWNATKGNLTHTIFRNNYADYGSALCREAGATGGFGYNNTFESNHAYIAGPALAWMGSAGINIDTYTFNDNTADVMGGAIYIAENSPDCVINNSQFNRNKVTNTTGGFGGAIFCMADNATVINTTFDENRATHGGAIYIGSSSGNANIYNATFTKNIAYSDGGAIALRASSVTVNDSHFNYNEALSGGAIYVGGDGLTSNVTYSTFNGNKALDGNGGAIDWVASTGNIFYSNFTENTATYGGAVYIGGESINSKISHVIFDTNKASENGGAIDWNATGGNLTHTLFLRNEAKYGAALCREANSGEGFGYNNTFTSNRARISGAALAWLSTNNIKIDTYYFYNNTAEVSGGAIYVDAGSPDCKVLNSIFSGSIVRTGYGGDIAWIGQNGYVYNTTFENSTAAYGGSIFVNTSSTNTQIINSSFTSCYAFVLGGAMYWLGDEGKLIDVDFRRTNSFEDGGAIYGTANNMMITNSSISYAVTGGAFDENDVAYGSGALHWENARGLNISNTKFFYVETHAHGAGIAAVNCNDSTLYNVSIEGTIALKNGGAIYWVNSSRLSIDACEFKDCEGAFGGGALYLYDVDTIIRNSTFNHTQSSWALGGAIYIHGDVQVINSTFERFEAQNNKASAIYFDTGVSEVTDSDFNGLNPLFVSENANVTLTRNNVTRDYNTQIPTLSYSVWNDGDLWLSNNTFNGNYIYNNGTIHTQAYISVLDNKTHNVTLNDNFTFWANITDDNENPIISVCTLNTTNDHKTGWYLLPYNKATIPASIQGKFIINASDVGLEKYEVKTGTLNVKARTGMNLTYNKTKDEGEEVIIRAVVHPHNNGFDFKGNVTFYVNGVPYSRQISANGEAVLNLTGLPQGNYKVTAIYNESDYYRGCENSTDFNINLRKTWIEIIIRSVTYNQYAVANVTTNGNGTVLLFMNGRNEKFNMSKADGTYKNENNMTYMIVNGTLVVPFDTIYDPGNYSMAVVYLEDDYYEYALNQTNFTVYKLNTTLSIDVNDTVYRDTVEIIISVPGVELGNVKVNINGTEYMVSVVNEKAYLNVTGLAVDKYNITANFTGSKYYNATGYASFFNVTKATPVMYVVVNDVQAGQNATITVYINNTATGNITVKVNGETYNGTIEGYMVTLTTKALPVGVWDVNVTYEGDRNYTVAYNNASKINVTEDVGYEMNMTVNKTDIIVGENVTVTVYLPNDTAGKNVTFSIKGLGEYNRTVNSNGTAVLSIKINNEGLYFVNATYGDAKYANKTVHAAFMASRNITQMSIEVNNTVVGNTTKVIVHVPTDVKFNVTIEIDGRKLTNVTNNGEAVFYLTGLTAGNKTVTAIYAGDNKYLYNATTRNFTVSKIKAAAGESIVNVTVHNINVTQAERINITAPADYNGTAIVNVSGTAYYVNITNGKGYVIIKNLPADTYLANVTLLENDKYYTSINDTQRFNVTKWNSTLDVNFTNITYGEAVQFNITLPDDAYGNVTITITGKASTQIAVYGGLNIIYVPKLDVGEYDVTVTYEGNYKYLTNTSGIMKLKVNPALPTDGFTVRDLGNGTVMITVPNGAEGYINLTIANHRYNATLNNSAAYIDLVNETPGIKYANVTYSGDNTHSNMTKYNEIIIIPKYQTPITVSVNDTVVGNTTRIIVNVPANVSSNVTIEIDGMKYNKTVDTTGKAVFELNLTAGGKTVTAIYYGDDEYLFNATTRNFTVSKVKAAAGQSIVNVTVSDINVTQDARINITAPADFNGTAVVKVNDVEYYANITNGDGYVIVKGLGKGHYPVNVTLLENDKYYTSYNDTESFDVSKWNSTLIVVYDNITVGDNVVLNITVPMDAYGNVTIKIANKTVTAAVYGGLNTIIVEGIPVGVHDVNVTYNGNFKYNEKNSTASINVTPIVTTLNDVIITDYRNGTVIIKVIGNNATGNVTVKHKTEKYTVNLTNASAVVDLTVFNNTHPGANNFTIIYSGDANHNSVEYNTTLYMPKLSSEVNVTTVAIMVGGLEVITVNVTSGATGRVLIDINGTGYYVNLTGSEGILKLTGFKVGTYNVTVTYLGDDNYTESTNKGSFTVTEGITLTITGSGNNTVVSVSVPGSLSGNLTLLINNVTYKQVPVSAGTASVPVNNLTPGIYNLTAVFTDANKANTTAHAVLVIGLYDTPISIEVNDSVVGKTVKVIVTVPVNATQDITIAIDGEKITNTTVDGRAVFYITGLTAGNKTVTAIYAGNATYAFNATTRNFTVSKVKAAAGESIVNVTVQNINVTQTERIDITAPGDYNGTAVVEVDGVEYYANITNGHGFVDIKDLKADEYSVNVTLLENDKYCTSFNDTERFNVTKWNSTLIVKFDNITYGENAVFNVTIPADAYGNLTIKIGTAEYKFAVKAGLNRLIVEKLAVGNYTVSVTYGGNFKYNANTSAEMKLKVSPASPSEGFTVEDLGNRTVVVTVPDATGNVSLRIGDHVYNATLNNSVAYINLVNETPGVKIANVTYLGDGIHAAMSKNKRVVIPAESTPISITVPGTVYVDTVFTVTVNIPENITSGVVIEIDATEYTRADYSVAGKAVFTVTGLSAGSKTVTATFRGNENYTFNSTTEEFTVYKHSSFVNVNVTNITVGETAVINITAPDYNGIAIVKVNGVNYTAVIRNGFGQVNITRLSNDTYNINVTYVENDKYYSSLNDTVNFTVSKIQSELEVRFNNITVGENAVFYIKVSDYGNVTITIAGEDTIVGVMAGNNIIIIPDVKVGLHDVTVRYSGNYKYLENTTSVMKLNVNRTKTTPDDFKVNDTGNGTVIITVPENATGNITVIVNGENKTVNITNGTAVINILNITNATPGVTNITIIYSGDENNTNLTYNTTVVIPKWDVRVNATGVNIIEGFDEVISIVLTPVNSTSILPTGIVLVNINGTGYYANVTRDGKVSLTVKGLKEGNYTATVIYEGNEYYNEARTTTSFKVGEGIKVDVNGTGNSSIIVIHVPGNESAGNVTIYINGTNYTANVTNGTATFNLTNVTPGEHNVTIVYVDGNGTESEINSTITIPKWDARVNATAIDIIEGFDEIITINVAPINATGIVLVNINGTGYYVNVTTGSAKLVVKHLTEGTYNVTVIYLGNKYYNEARYTTSFKVGEGIKVDVNGTGNSSVIVIHVPGNESAGNVTIYINGTNHTVDVINGTATFNLTNVTPGEHNVTIVYVDGNGTESRINTTVTIPKWDSKVDFNVTDIREGAVEKITIIVTGPKEGFVHIDIAGKGYYANLTDGRAYLEIIGLTVDNYTATVTFLGDKYYKNSSATKSFKVTEGIKLDINGTGNSSVLVITVPGNETGGNVTVYIDGKNITANVTDGTAIINLTNVTPGKQDIQVIYVDANGTSSETNGTVVVPKWSSAVDFNVTDIREGAVETITIEVFGPKEGFVHIDIAGKGYYANFTDGKASIDITGLTFGEYNATVTFTGDDKYNSSSLTKSFKVAEGIKLDINGTGNSSVLVIRVPGNETGGNVTVYIDGKNITANVTDGVAIINLTNVTPGKQDIQVIYVDANGTSSETNGTINVPKWSSAVDFNVTDIREGSVETITIEVTGPKDGFVHIDIAGKGYYANFTGGKASIDITGLTFGEYNATVTFTGDDKYNSSSLTKSFKVTEGIKLEINGTGNSSVLVIRVPGNETGGNVTVYIDGKNITANVTNGTAIINLTNVTPGKQDIKVVYVDANGTSSETNGTINVPKWSSAVDFNVTDIREGSVETIPITVSGPVEGIVLVDINGKGYYANFTGGKASIDIAGLTFGEYNVTVRFDGDDKYNKSSLIKSFKVTEGIKLDINGTGNSSTLVITVPGNETGGNVTVYIDGKNITANVTNGTAIINLTNVTPGKQDIKVVYVDANGTSSETNGTITVPKWSSAVDFNVTDIREGAVETISIVVTGPKEGFVHIDVAGKGYYANLTDGKATVDIVGLTFGDYNTTVTFIADDKYNSSSLTKSFKVTEGIKLDINGTGNSSTLVIHVPGNETGGNVTVYIDGKNITANVTNGTAIINLTNITPGKQDIKVVYVDANGTSSETNGTITVPKWSSAVDFNVTDIREGSVETIPIEIVGPKEGIVLVDIAGKGYYVNFTNGKATLDVSGLTAGNYSVTVRFDGDDIYNSSSLTKSFKVTEGIKLDINGTGNSSTLVITVPGNETGGNVTVYIDGKNITANVTNGTAIINLTNVTPGKQDIKVVYVDRNGTSSETNGTINVPKWSSAVDFNVTDIREGAVETIEIVVTGPKEGFVHIDIAGKGYYANLTDGRASVDIVGLTFGEYNATVTFVEDDKYNSSSLTKSFKVTEGIKLDINGTGNSSTLVITVPGNETGGNVTVYVDGKNFTANVTNGTAIINLTNVTPGKQDIQVIYVDANGTSSETNGTIIVPKWSSAVDFNVTDIREGSVETITIEVIGPQNGFVHIDIAGKGYYANFTDGKATIDIDGLKEGDYTATVSFMGDDKYENSSMTKSFKVTEGVKLDINGTGNSSTLVITVPGNETGGNVTVYVDGKNFTANVTNGTAIINLTNVTPGKQDIQVIYVDANGTSSETNGTINVPKWSSAVDFNVTDIREGSVETITIEVTGPQNGFVHIDIAGKGYYANFTDGKAIIDIDGLKEGDYTATVSFMGDDKYENSSMTKSFKVTEGIKLDINGTGNSSTLVITVPGNETGGNVTVYVDGKNFTANVTNGTAIINLTNVTPGKQDIQVIYVDANGTSSETNGTINVPKWSSAVDFNVTDIREGTTETIPIVITGPKEGIVLVDINGKGYYANFTNGQATIDITGLTEGNYTATVRFAGDDLYEESSMTKEFKVTPGIKIDLDGSGNKTVINITVPGNATGNVTVIVDGKNYTTTNLTNGSAVVNLTDLEPGEHNVTVIYRDANGTETVANKTITISLYDTPISINVTDILVGDVAKVTVTLPTDGDVTIEINGVKYTNATNNGVALFDVKDLIHGVKTVVATFAGNSKYAFNSTTANFTVSKRESSISVNVSDIKAGEKAEVVISNVPSDATGYVIVNINGTEYGINLTAGETSVSALIVKGGEYDVVVTYLGDEKYLESANSTKFTAAKAATNATIIVSNATVGGNSTVRVILPDDAQGNITVAIDNQTVVTVPAHGGENVITVPATGEGEHTVNVTYSGDGNYESSSKVESIYVQPSVYAEDKMTRGWNSLYDFEAEFLDGDGNVLKDTEVTFKVNGKTYTVKTDEKGTAKLTNSHLAVGDYNVTIINPVTGEEITKKLSIVPRLIGNKDMTMDFADGSIYVVRVIGDDGKPVGAGEIVRISANGIHYAPATDSNGYARLKIELNPKTYTVTAQYKAYKVSNKLKVKQTLKLVKKTIKIKKKTAKKIVLKAKLKWSSGKPIKGKKITFTFKGKKYTAKTNKKGIAKVKVKKKVVKKLKKGKKYKYTAKYLTNKVKGKVKVKK